ncbi:hypothetical protein M409DRAFT_52290 [Zasmidium cellare ATCC 36951]|uniref:NAD(P)-binding protein n=1 Tax=Zasmidium cellare ATCC 36951 TaxID=1080233 RepID=A0A6A6CVG0_ZASCE|nr:uncharacterized protein M409DRAFT_52290 [Zasmidium cellare ATCC 36951]KAF2169789.1 hypothetical protein M409DRAFT_52290 [Zasmidium cellare ATCC 36951]
MSSHESRFTGKVTLITGAASGIGRATAHKLASQGSLLALQDINEAGLQETNNLCGGKHYTETFSVADPAKCTTFVQNTLRTLHRIDHVFNCAGVNPTAYALTETTDAYFSTLVDTNLKGTYNLTRAVVPHLGQGSSIVNVSSTMGISVAAQYAIYCATKWAIVGFTKAMALELGGQGVRVNAVAPGYIDTPTNAGVLAGSEAVEEQVGRVALGRMGTAEEVADVVAFLFSEEARYMSGSIVEITGGRKT